MINTVIFDMGRVLVDYQCEPIIKTKTNDPDLIRRIVAYVFGSGQWVLLDAGLISLEDALAAMLTHFNENEHDIVSYCFYHWIDANLFPRKDMGELVKALHHKGYRLFVLSNANCLMHKIETEIIPNYDLFEKVYFSCDYRMIKPQYPLYQLVIDEQHLNPNECLFVDDLKDNVEAAKVCGMHGVVFNGDVQCVINALEQVNGKGSL